MLIDCNAWIGDWPFADLPPCSATDLAQQLGSVGVERALVSDLGGVLAPHRGRLNENLLDAAESIGGVDLLAAPIIDPTLSDAPQRVARYAQHERTAAIRLLPGFHQYRLFNASARAVIEAAAAHELLVMIQMRIEDHRMQSALLHASTPFARDVLAIAAAYPKVTFLITAALRGEAPFVTEGSPNVLVDLSWLDGPEPARSMFSACSEQLVFGTHAPLFVPRAALQKLIYDGLTETEIEKVRGQNIERAHPPIAGPTQATRA